MPLLSRPFYFLGFAHISQDESYDLHDRKAFAKFLIDADIRLVPWMSPEVVSCFCLVVRCVAETDHKHWVSLQYGGNKSSKVETFEKWVQLSTVGICFFSIFLEVARKLQSSSTFFGMA